jgi:hypothetical protein
MTQPNLTNTALQERMVNAVEELTTELATEISRLSETIVSDTCRTADATGMSVTCLTEAVMGATSALTSIAYAINRLAEAICDR